MQIFFPSPDTVRFFFVSQRTCTLFFCMHVYNFFSFLFYIFWYIIGIKLDKYWCKTLCSLNNERTSIQKMVVLYFFTPTPMMNMYVKKTTETTIIYRN